MDHDHSTGKVRGILCYNCNTAIGHAMDSPERLTSLATYLREHQKQNLKEYLTV